MQSYLGNKTLAGRRRNEFVSHLKEALEHVAYPMLPHQRTWNMRG